jgi:hypothetical protein
VWQGLELVEEHESCILEPQTVVRFVLKSQIANQFKTYNYSVISGSECLQTSALAWGFRVRFQIGAGNFSLHHLVQTGSGVRPASCTIGTRTSFPG